MRRSRESLKLFIASIQHRPANLKLYSMKMQDGTATLFVFIAPHWRAKKKTVKSLALVSFSRILGGIICKKSITVYVNLKR